MVDKIKELIKQMESFAEKQQYEDAQKSLVQIKEELDKPHEPSNLTVDQLLGRTKREVTIKDTNEVLTGNSIRLNPNYYPFSKWLLLLTQVNEIQNQIGHKFPDNIRKIVAEQMVCKQMTIPPTYRGKKPNRAFLDETLKVKGGVDICGNEMERRLKSLLWQAVETKDWNKIDKAKADLSKFRRTKSNRDYD